MCYRTISSQFESSSKELFSTTLPWFKFIFWPCWALTEQRLQWELCFILSPPGRYWKSWDESGQHRCCTQRLKAKHSAAIMFEHLGDLEDYFLFLHSKQKNTFHVDINFYNTALKTKQPQNSVDCTQDDSAWKLEAACWHFSKKKKKCVCTHRRFLFFTRSTKLWGLFPPHAARGRDRLVFAVHEHLGTRRSCLSKHLCASEVVSSMALSNPWCWSLILPIKDRDFNLKAGCPISVFPGQSY